MMVHSFLQQHLDLSWALEYGTAAKNPANNKINVILINFII